MRKLTPDIVRQIRQYKTEDWRISYVELAEWVEEEYGILVSRETVRLAILRVNWSAVHDSVAAHATSYGHE